MIWTSLNSLLKVTSSILYINIGTKCRHIIISTYCLYMVCHQLFIHLTNQFTLTIIYINLNIKAASTRTCDRRATAILITQKKKYCKNSGFLQQLVCQPATNASLLRPLQPLQLLLRQLQTSCNCGAIIASPLWLLRPPCYQHDLDPTCNNLMRTLQFF